MMFCIQEQGNCCYEFNFPLRYFTGLCVCVCFKKSAIKVSNSLTWGFPGDPVAKNRLPMQEKWVPSLMGEDHEYWGAANP